MANLALPIHDNETLLEYEFYWDSHDITIDEQIRIVKEINNGNSDLLETLAPYYNALSTLLFDKLYCADYHHIYKAIISTEGTKGMNQDVINEFITLNFEGKNFNYEDLLKKIRLDIIEAVKSYSYDFDLKQLKKEAEGRLDQYISKFETRYWCRVEFPHLIHLDKIPSDQFVTIRRSEQLIETLTEKTDELSYYICKEVSGTKIGFKVHYNQDGVSSKDTYFFNISMDEYLNKQIKE